MINIDPLSAVSLLLEVRLNDRILGTATGFIVQNNGQNFLITNWHVVSGRNTDTGECLSSAGDIPNAIVIVHHLKDKLGNWVLVKYPLYNNEKPNWILHPKHTEENRIDVIALPIGNTLAEIAIYPLDLSLADTDMLASPALSVSIIGFPFGMASDGAFPIWKTGHIASDPDLNYKGLPVFLIDATTRSGMSGAPVILKTNTYIPKSGGFVVRTGYLTLFLGVYSGRIRKDIEIGRVWKPQIIKELLQQSNALSNS